MTNEQSVVEAEKELAKLKEAYTKFLTPLAIAVTSGSEPSLAQLLECQRLGAAYFNYAETFVANSGLLKAHKNGRWVTNLAESCYSILESYIQHMLFLRSHVAAFPTVANTIEPSSFAYASMQRMVREYLDRLKSNKLQEKFEINNLPIQGFLMPAARDEIEVSTWQRVAGAVIGAVLVAGSIATAVAIPSPTRWQEFVFRACLALGIGALAALVPGFVNVNARLTGWRSTISVAAGGAIAIFVLTWLYNPESVSHPTDKPQSAQKTLAK